MLYVMQITCSRACPNIQYLFSNLQFMIFVLRTWTDIDFEPFGVVKYIVFDKNTIPKWIEKMTLAVVKIK